MARISLGINTASLNAQRRLAESASRVVSSAERLSSGRRINRAADDAAGLAVASALTNDKRVFTQGIRNLNDSQSLLNVAESSIEGLVTITTRLRELAEQAANGTYSGVQRKALDAEAQALSKEFTRISRATQFNGLGLFDGSVQGFRTQDGYGSSGGIAGSLGGALATGQFATDTSRTVTPAASATSSTVSTGDFNGDGVSDIVAVGYSGGTGYVSVLLSNGDGTFAAPKSYASTGSFSAVGVGDLNNDGILDIVAGGTSVTASLLGRGDGTFSTATTYASNGAVDLSIADVNGDGKADVVTAAVAGDRIAVQLGNGDGSFARARTFTKSGSSNDGLTLGDVNGDGILDAVTNSSSLVEVQLGRADGTFGSATGYATPTATAGDVKLSDLNGDGYLDLISAGSTGGGGAMLSIRLGSASGTFGARTDIAGASDGYYGIATGDFNGDGVQDIAVNGVGSQMVTDVFVGNGNGTFRAPNKVNHTDALLGIATGDFNADGVWDLAHGNYVGTVATNLGSTQDGINPLLDFSLRTQSDARQAMSVFDRKLQSLSTQRGQIGGIQSRLVTAAASLQARRDNVEASASRIVDVDVASESAKLVREQILQQAGAQVLGEANQLPSIALALLSGGA